MPLKRASKVQLETAAVFVFILTAFPAQGRSVYVSPSGDDGNPGALNKPFATLSRAQAWVRKYVEAGLKENVTVYLRGGTYFLEKPLTFDGRDTGSSKFSITYRAYREERPVLSGGRLVTGWKKGKSGLWAAKPPGKETGGVNFRQLFVGGSRAVRARTPNKGGGNGYWRLKGAELSRGLKTHTLLLAPEKLNNIPDCEGLEVVVLKNWATFHKKVREINRKQGVVRLKPPHVDYRSGNRPRKGCACYFENALAFLDVQGEWFFDRERNLIYYKPRDGERMDDIEVIAPQLTCLLSVQGTGNGPVRNLHFEGLEFMHTYLPLPPEGHHGRQACFRYGKDNYEGAMPCAVRWEHVVGSSFRNCSISHTGGGAIALKNGCHRNLVEGNEVWDCSGNGINLGGRNSEDLVPKGNRIANNYVHHCGRVYFGACAIWVGFAQKTTISHNLVRNHPYTGISIGWQWNSSPTVAREYVVEFNHVYDVMKEVSDGGAIYSLGYQPGTVIRGNLLHHVHRSQYAHAAPNNGIFFDQGSKGFVLEKNVIYETSGRPVRFNQSKKEFHKWKDNLIGTTPEAAKQTETYKKAGLEPAFRSKLLK